MKLNLYCFLTLLILSGCASAPTSPKGDSDAQFTTVKQLALKGQVDVAISELSDLIRENPDNAEYRNWMLILKDKKVSMQVASAESLLRDKKYAEAEEAYLLVIKNNPSNSAAKLGLERALQAKKHAALLSTAQQAWGRGEAVTAQNILRDILAENSQDTDAKQLYEKIQQIRNSKVTATPTLQTSFKKPVTLELKSAPIKSAFEYLSKAGNINFAYDEQLSDAIRVNLFLRNTPIEDAIDVILSSHQLGKKVLNSNTLLIYPLTRAQEYQELYVRSFYLNSIDVKRAMNLVKTIVGAKDVYVDEKLNTLVMRDTLEKVEVAEKLIASQDISEPEVMLEVEVMEINRRNLEQLGLQYPSQVSLGVQGNAKSNTTAGIPVAGQLTLTELKHFNGDFGVFSVNDPAIVLNLLHQDTDTNLLANPKIRVKNRDKAKIHVGDKIPVLTSVANAQGFVSQTVNYLEVGIKLDVEPTVQLQDQVSIKMGLEVSNITDQVKTDNGVLAYTIGSRNAMTTLQLKNNETQILAGLIRDDRQKISRKLPGLSKLPLIGRLFSDQSDDARKNEIVLLVTPRILNNVTPASATYTAFPAGVDHAGLRGGAGQANQVTRDAQPQAQPMVAPQNTQIDRAKVDADFANQLTNSAPPDTSVNTNTTIIKAQ